MTEFPALEVVTRGPHGLPVGHRIPLGPRGLVLGRSAESDVILHSALVSRRHCEVRLEYERWWVRDVGSSHGTFVRGERIHDAELQHGDCFEMPWGVSFRLWLHEPIVFRHEALERALLQSPDDEAVWAVYADALLDAGDPLGARLGAPSTAEQARWLGPLARDAAVGNLEVSWAHGLPSTVVVRWLSADFPEVSWEQMLGALIRAREFHFVRRLQLDLGSFARNGLSASWVRQALALVGSNLPFLEQLLVGPATLSESAGFDLTACLDKHPRLLGQDAVRVVPWEPMELVVEYGSVDNAFAIRFENDRWWLDAEREVFLNGHPVVRAQLRPGDEVTSLSGVVSRFQPALQSLDSRHVRRP
jgi:uncharacterized protein (TIGR02996 family)